MGRTEPLGKVVKKWLGQGKDLFFISDLLSSTPNFADVTPQKCLDAYRRYMGVVGVGVKNKSSDDLLLLVKRKKPIHIYGESGVGKSYLIKQIADKLGLYLFISYPRSEEDLAKDFGEFPFQEDIDALFVLEGDAYYWKRYGLIKNYIENSKNSFVIITMGKETPTKNVTKLLTQVKVFPPTRSDVANFILTTKPGFVGHVQDIYDKDWRKIWHNIRYGKTEIYTPKRIQTMDAKTLSYKLIKGTAKYEDFDACIHPISFVLNWLGYNSENFWEGKELRHNLDIISWCDANKYVARPSYLKGTLLQLIPSQTKGILRFPPFKRKENEEKKVEEKYTITKMKQKKVPAKKQKILIDAIKKPVEEYKGLDDILGDFGLL